jgi:molybdenum cofactor synthesis domain-containing protein
MPDKIFTAAILIIGNEILSGRTQDTNVQYLGQGLNELGIRLMEVRVVPDVEDDIVDAVNALRSRFDYLFTTGGIGPTHDDITTACVSKAFGVAVVRDAEAEKLLLARYKPEDVTEARMKMADVADGATLIDNPVSAAPGYRIENVFVMAGVPRIMQAMFDGIKGDLQGGDPVLSKSIEAYIPEGVVAGPLGDLQDQYPDVDMGSYPFFCEGRLGTCLVARSPDAARLDAAADAIEAMVGELSAETNT